MQYSDRKPEHRKAAYGTETARKEKKEQAALLFSSGILPLHTSVKKRTAGHYNIRTGRNNIV